ncbi:MAG: malto-oligosyltrehalose trehalohydrolase [Pirellulaceae bacterium]
MSTRSGPRTRPAPVVRSGHVTGGEPLLRHGFRRDGEGGAWRVWAPRAEQLDLVLLTETERQVVAMESAGEGWYVHSESHVPEGQRYLFRLPSGRELPDPAARWQPDGVHAPSAVWSGVQARWSDSAWSGLPLGELAIYELHTGTFTPEGTFAGISRRLDELRELGVNCIEVMPVAQFPGHRGWGYDGVYPYAVQQSYGGPEELARLVDACHTAGLAILLDVVYNHLGPEGNYLSEFGPYFTSRYGTPWGAAWNYDAEGSDHVRAYVLDNVRYWLREFHFDGLRLDAVQEIHDESAKHILQEIQEVADEESARLGRVLHIIAESNQNDVKLLREPAHGGYGLNAQWSDDFHHTVHTLLTGERDGYYSDFGDPPQLAQAINQAFVYDGQYSSYRRRHYGTSAKGMARERFVVCVQNHDQTGNRALGERFGELLTPAQQRLAAGTLLLSPYTPLLFMGEEYGESRRFPFFCEFSDPQLVEAVRRGRREEYAAFPWPDQLPDPHLVATFESALLSWEWEVQASRAGLRHWYQDLLRSRRLWPRLPDTVQQPARWLDSAVSPVTSHDRAATEPALVTSSPAGGAGVLKLVRYAPQDDAPPSLWAYLNFHSRPVELPEDEVGADAQLLLSSEWPRYGGARPDDSWVPVGGPWRLRAYEVLVFADRRRRTAWQIV